MMPVMSLKVAPAPSEVFRISVGFIHTCTWTAERDADALVRHQHGVKTTPLSVLIVASITPLPAQ